MADWQGRLLVFHKLVEAFENDKYRNSGDTDFQRDDTFPLVSSKLNWTTRRKPGNSDKVLSGSGSKTHIGNKEIVNENLPVPKRKLNCCGTACYPAPANRHSH